MKGLIVAAVLAVVVVAASWSLLAQLVGGISRSLGGLS